MAITRNLGPGVITGPLPSATNSYTTPVGEDTPAPSMAWGGMGIIDPRFAYQDTQYTRRCMGWAGGDIMTIDQAPAASAANNIAASAVPVANTPMTLVTSGTSAVSQITTAFQVWPSGNTIPANALVLDTLPTPYVGLPTNSAVWWYNPNSSIARAVKVVSAGNDGTAHFLIQGYDLYGYPQTEYITGGSAAAANGNKTWKYITSVTPSGTLSGSNVSVGTQDVFGFPIAASKFMYLNIYWNSALITSTTGFTAASLTSPATSATGDVRGTYAVQSAADGTKQLQVVQFIIPSQLNTGTAAALVGVQPA